MSHVEHLLPSFQAQVGVFPYQDTNQETFAPAWQMGHYGEHFFNQPNFLNQENYFTNYDEIDSNQLHYLNQSCNFLETTFFCQSESLDSYRQTQLSDQSYKSNHNTRKEKILEAIRPNPDQILPTGPACLTNADKCKKYRDKK